MELDDIGNNSQFAEGYQHPILTITPSLVSYPSHFLPQTYNWQEQRLYWKPKLK